MMQLVGFAVIALGVWVAFTSIAAPGRAGGLMVATAGAAVALFPGAAWELVAGYIALAP